MNRKRFSALKGCIVLFVCSVWVSPGFSIPVSHNGSLNVEVPETHGWSTWQEYAVYLVSQQLCDAAQSDESGLAKDMCLSVIADMATKSAMVSTLQYPNAFESYGWHDDTLLIKANLPSGELLAAARLDIRDAYDRSQVAGDVDQLESSIKSLTAADSTVKEVIPGSLLVTILALVGIVAVARRDIPGKDAIEFAKDPPELGVASTTYLRHGTSQYEKLHQ